MILATKIQLRRPVPSRPKEQDILAIFLLGERYKGYYPKEQIHDMLVLGEEIRVDIYPYPYLEPMLSPRGEKYVRSEPNKSPHDNLLNLPRG